MRTRGLLLVAVGFGSLSLTAAADDWPQWRGPNRDAKVTGFKAPAAWPKELTKKWTVPVGNGVANPSLVGDKFYVIGREGADEVVRCLDAATGSKVWEQKYASPPAAGAAGRFPGPRSTPTVANGKVVTVSANGTLSCFDAATGTPAWVKDEYKGKFPRFYTSSSPIVIDGLCVAQLGGEGSGVVVAYDLSTGAEKWKWTGGTPSYASPVLMTVGGTKLIIAQLSDSVVALTTDGKLALRKYFDGPGRSAYKASTPIVNGSVLIYSDGNPKAVRLENEGDKIVAKDVWTDSKDSVEFNTPTLKDNLLVGISGDYQFFAFNTQTGETAWTVPAPRPAGGRGGKGAPPGGGKGGGGKGAQGKGGGKGGGMGKGEGYGSIVDAGSVLMALTPAAQLIVFQATDKEFKEVASYKVSDKPTHSHPIVAGNRIYIKDEDSLTLWTIP